MDVQSRLKLIGDRADEILLESELAEKMNQNVTLNGYVGFELSGFFHIGIGLIMGREVENMVKAGIKMKILLADWHSLINNKLGGDMDAIRTAGEYFELAFKEMGADGPNVEYVWGSDIVDNSAYWRKVIEISKSVTLTRVKRTLPIMGRKESGEMEASFLFYPPMQAADIFQMDLDVALGGMDQRKIHVLAREVAARVGNKKPISIHTPMLIGLKGPGSRMDISDDISEIKMSKSKPDTCIFIHDGPTTSKRKINKAYCPEGDIENNSVLEIAKHALFKENNFKLEIVRPEKFGGDVKYDSISELGQAFQKKEVHPADLKNAVAGSLSLILKDVRQKLEKHDDVMATMSRLTGVKVEFE